MPEKIIATALMAAPFLTLTGAFLAFEIADARFRREASAKRIEERRTRQHERRMAKLSEALAILERANVA